MTRRLRRLVCRVLGHRPVVALLAEPERISKATRCGRCADVLSYEEHEGTYPIPEMRFSRHSVGA